MEANIKTRFMARIKLKQGPIASPCWLWRGQQSGGYGKLKHGGKWYSAHRLSFELHYRELKEGEVVRHLCNVSLCVNPEHLTAGTKKQNEYDKVISA